MSQYLSLDISLNLIQGIRLAHALMETNYEICILPEDEIKFSILKKIFNVNYTTTNEIVKKLPGIKITHSQPLTKIGSIEKPLVFPHTIFDYCRKSWQDNRNNKFTFAGLVTDSRREVFEKWLTENYPDENLNLKKWSQDNLLSKLKTKVLNKLGLPPEIKIMKSKNQEILLWSSNRGRSFPVKSWDDNYFQLLADSQFVLCPQGDFIWSYRFFEATMCGAIPIIETYCPAYADFRFKTMEESTKSMIWLQEDAEYNYELCRSRLTINKDILETEIASLLAN